MNRLICTVVSGATGILLYLFLSSMRFQYEVNCPALILQGDPLGEVEITGTHREKFDNYTFTEDNAVNYLMDWSDSLYDHGVAGGNYRLHFDPASSQLLLQLTFTTAKPLSESQKTELLEYSRADICGGVGEGFYWHLIDHFQTRISFRSKEASLTQG